LDIAKRPNAVWILGHRTRESQARVCYSVDGDDRFGGVAGPAIEESAERRLKTKRRTQKKRAAHCQDGSKSWLGRASAACTAVTLFAAIPPEDKPQYADSTMTWLTQVDAFLLRVSGSIIWSKTPHLAGLFGAPFLQM
jgi:hypothetical protein